MMLCVVVVIYENFVTSGEKYGVSFFKNDTFFSVLTSKILFICFLLKTGIPTVTISIPRRDHACRMFLLYIIVKEVQLT